MLWADCMYNYRETKKEEGAMKATTLCYIEKDDSYLMLHRTKKENDANKDKWIGVGGHFLEGETPEECICREVLEETGYTLLSYKLRGIIDFISDIYEDETMYLFTADEFSGEQIACDEGNLEWVKKSEMLSLPLWEGDKIFLKLLLEDAPFFRLKLEYKGDHLLGSALSFD